MATSRRAETVSLDGLAKSIDRALTIAAERHSVTFVGDTVTHGWVIYGRQLKDAKALPLEVSKTVLANLPKPARGLPVVLGWGKGILVGFWDPELGRRIGL